MNKDVTADIFARAFVMPKERFIKVAYENTKDNVCDVHKVAEIFGVEYMDAYIRGKELELWK